MLDESFRPDEWFHLGIEAVAHELKLAIWRDEGDRSIVLESGQSNTLVKLDVLHLNCLAT